MRAAASKTLQDFLDLLEVDIQTAQVSETWDRFVLQTSNLSHAKAMSLSEEQLNTIGTAFGSPLEVRIGPENQPLFLLKDGELQEDYAESVTRLQRWPENVDLDAHISIEKNVEFFHKFILANQTWEGENPIHLRYFFLWDILLKNLGWDSELEEGEAHPHPIIELDKHLFSSRVGEPTLLIVGDKEIRYQGHFLNIIGEQQLAETEFEVKLSSEKETNQEHFRSIVDNRPRMRDFELKSLTPLHFICRDASGEPDSRLDKLFYAYTLDLLILFSASYSRCHRVDGSCEHFQAVYDAADGEFSITANAHIAQLDDGNISQLERFADWVVAGHEYSEKLSFFRRIVALEQHNEESGTSAFFHKKLLSTWNKNLEQHWGLYAEGKLKKHFEQLEAVNQVAQQTATSIAGEIDGFTKELTGAFLTALGVTVGTFITAIVNTDISDFIFSWGLKGYAIYIIAFSVIYRMVSVHNSYTLLILQAESRFDSLGKLIGESSDVVEWKKPLPEYQENFRFWFRVTVLLYLSIAGYLLLLSEGAGRFF